MTTPESTPTKGKIAIFVGTLALYVCLAATGFWLLAHSRTTESIQSPWQTISPFYIYIFFAATLLLGLIIFFVGRGMIYRAPTVLTLLVLHTMLLHSYLPLTHNLLYGSDQWRHIAVESRIVEGLPYLTPKLSDGTTGSALNNAIGRVSYGGLWFISAGIGKSLQLFLKIDTTSALIVVNKWLVPIWWSITMPLLLYALGRALKWNMPQSLFFSWLSFLPFALQAPGAMTLPVSFGLPVFVGSLILLLHRAKQAQPTKKIIIALTASGVILLFCYLLYAVLFWLGWAVAECMLRNKEKGIMNKTATVILLIIVALTLPALEMLAGYSRFNLHLNLFAQLKKLFGNLTVWYLATGPRPHVIDTGNIIFNQIPSYAFVSNYLTVWRWWLVIFMLAFWVLVIKGVVGALKAHRTEYTWLTAFGGGIFGSYVLSRYFLLGEQVLTRRLDPILAIFFLIFLAIAVWNVVNKISKKYLLIISALIFLTFAVTASYSLGPNTSTVSVQDYQTMQNIWNEEPLSTNHCVIANTNQLLALEAISKKEIIGGGFPIDPYFGQPELIALYQQLSEVQLDAGFNEALKITNAAKCSLVLPNKVIVKSKI